MHAAEHYVYCCWLVQEGFYAWCKQATPSEPTVIPERDHYGGACRWRSS